MVEHYKQGRLMWVNLKNPSADEIKKVMKELNISPLLLADLTSPVKKSNAVQVESTIKITLDFPVVKRLDISHPYEVKFIISKHSLLTVQYEEMEGIDRFKRQFEVAAALKKNQKNITGAHMFLSLITHLYESVSTKLDYLDSRLTEMEVGIFKNNERKMVYHISNASKKLIAFRHIMQSHDNVFREAIPLFEEVYDTKYTASLLSIQNTYYSLLRRANAQFETVSALRDTNSAMLYTKQNEVMKNLTIMAFITFPLTLFSSLFGMNTQHTPIIGFRGDFWIIVGGMLIAAVIFFIFFKRKGWM
jgi:magnesium transporter